MNLKQETWEIILQGMEDQLIFYKNHVNELLDQHNKNIDDIANLKKELTDKCNEVSLLKLELREYEKKDEIEHFIKQMGRKYNNHTSWVGLFYRLYPSADEKEYQIRGKAKEAIINLLRSRDLRFDDGGMIFKS